MVGFPFLIYRMNCGDTIDSPLSVHAADRRWEDALPTLVGLQESDIEKHDTDLNVRFPL
jgi:hypothetical protein